MHNKGKHFKKKDNLYLGENICKQCNQQQINIQNMRTVHIARYQKGKQPNQNMGRRSKKILHQRRDTDDQQAHEKCPTSLIIREIQVKTSIMYYLIPVRTAIIKKSINNKCWRECGEKNPHYTVGENVSCHSHHGEQ